MPLLLLLLLVLLLLFGFFIAFSTSVPLLRAMVYTHHYNVIQYTFVYITYFTHDIFYLFSRTSSLSTSPRSYLRVLYSKLKLKYLWVLALFSVALQDTPKTFRTPSKGPQQIQATSHLLSMLAAGLTGDGEPCVQRRKPDHGRPLWPLYLANITCMIEHYARSCAKIITLSLPL